MPFSLVKRLTILGAATAALAAAACTESTAPPAVDPSAMATAVTNFDASFTQNQVFQSLVALGGTAPLGAVVARAVEPLTAVGAAGPAWTTSARQLRSQLLRIAAAPNSVETLFFSNLLGKTFQWDTTSPAGYRITDSTLAGAPSNGVRFLLYEVNDTTKLPRIPLYPIGYLDLADVSTVSANALHVLLKVGGQTAADYTVTENKTTANLSLAAVGYVTNVTVSGPTVTFNLSHLLTYADTSLTTDYEASNGSAVVSLKSNVHGPADSLSGTLDWTVTQGGSVEVVGVSEDTVNIQFKFNGTTFAKVTGPRSNASLTSASGQQLTAAQTFALFAILNGMNSIYFNLSLVFAPALLVFS